MEQNRLARRVQGLCRMPRKGPKREIVMQSRIRLATRTTAAALSFLMLASVPATSEQSIDSGGGGVRTAQIIDFSAQGEDFLEDGGGNRTAPDIYVTDEREEFLEDGGGIRTAPDIYSTNEREEFLEDGGSIKLKPNFDVLTVRGRHRAWRVVEPQGVSTRSQGSFTMMSTGASGHRAVPSRASAWKRQYGFDAVPNGPRIIDVARERLDRRPLPASGIDIIETGGSKIIRIAPNYDRHAAAELDRSARPARKARAGEPWTREWLNACTRAHPSFDPNFGTYMDAAGNSLFCAGG